MSETPPNRNVWLASALWFVVFAVATLLLLGGHIVANCWHVYATAAQHWWERKPLYDLRSIDDFQYFPQTAMAVIPIERLGLPWSGVVWRALGWFLYAHALWRVSGLGWTAPRQRVFLVTSVLVVPAAVTSLLNGQANLHLAALMMLVAVDLREQRRWRVTLWLTVGLALKPLMLVLLLLTCVFDPSLIWRLALSVGLVALLPFATAPAAYVAAQYRDCARKLMISAQPNRYFEDLRGLLWRLGWSIPFPMLRRLSLVAALGAAGLCHRVRRVGDERAASLLMFAIAAAYLMLFNSRNQPNSYVIIAPAAALPAALFASSGRWRPATLMASMVACWYGSAIPPTAYWLKPLTCIVFCVLLIRTIRMNRPSLPAVA